MRITNIHAHWATIPATTAWIVSTINKTNFTFTSHAWDIFQADNMLELKIAAAAKAITISEFNKHYLETKFPAINKDKIDIIHIGLDLKKFKPRRKLQDSTFTIISIGRMVETKGFQFLLKACKLLHEKNLQFRCQIIYIRDNFERHVFSLYEELGLKGFVELIPEIPQEEIIDYFNNSDCFVLPCIVGKDGDRDGIPTVILEALAMELPVITTPVSGIPEVIRDGETGLLVEPENADELAAAIIRLYSDIVLREKLGKAGRDFVNQHFEISSNVDRLLKIIF